MTRHYEQTGNFLEEKIKGKIQPNHATRPKYRPKRALYDARGRTKLKNYRHLKTINRHGKRKLPKTNIHNNPNESALVIYFKFIYVHTDATTSPWHKRFYPKVEMVAKSSNRFIVRIERRDVCNLKFVWRTIDNEIGTRFGIALSNERFKVKVTISIANY